MRREFSLTCADALLRGRTNAQEWQLITELRDHPNFVHGLLKYCDLIPAQFTGEALLNKVVTESARFEMLVYALYLYDTRDPDDPASGLTIANLTRLCAQQSVASRGRVIAILGIMELAGYLVRQRSPVDKRPVAIAPTPRLIAIVEDWNRRILEVIDAIDPSHALATAHARLPRLGWDMRTIGARTMLSGWWPLDVFPEIRKFSFADGGWMLLLTCVAQSLRASNGREIDAASVDLSAFGRRFGVSRSHLRRLLAEAYASGFLVEPPGNGQRIVPSHHFMAIALTWKASELAHYRAWAIEAKQRASAPAAGPGR